MRTWADFVNGMNGDDGYSFTRRLHGWDSPLTIHARPGYDDVTGVGSPAGSAFVAALGK